MRGNVAWGILAGLLIGAAAVGAAPTLASADDASCGSKENPCPLQKWMRQNMASAMSSGDMAALATAFEKSEKFAPDPKWNGPDPKQHWDAMSKAGIAAAKANDAAGVKAACKGCHDVYKSKYKEQFRTRPVP